MYVVGHRLNHYSCKHFKHIPDLLKCTYHMHHPIFHMAGLGNCAVDILTPHENRPANVYAYLYVAAWNAYMNNGLAIIYIQVSILLNYIVHCFKIRITWAQLCRPPTFLGCSILQVDEVQIVLLQS